MKVNVFYNHGKNNSIVTKKHLVSLDSFVKAVQYEKGVYTDDRSKFIPIESIVYYEVWPDAF